MRFCPIIIVVTLSISAPALAERGEVTHKQSGCDYFVVETNTGYDVLEWYGGYDPDKGDVLIGKFHTYGMHEIYDETANENLEIWVPDYDLSKEDALAKLVEQCD